jgi:hypothetical protein
MKNDKRSKLQKEKLCLDWSATAPISGESMVPSTVEKARTSDQAAGEGIDQPNCATELLNNKGANDWSAMLLKLL